VAWVANKVVPRGAKKESSTTTNHFLFITTKKKSSRKTLNSSNSLENFKIEEFEFQDRRVQTTWSRLWHHICKYLL